MVSHLSTKQEQRELHRTFN
jgi:calcium-dependent protein kinase